MKADKIGIIGGFGAYATLDFQRRLFEEFKGDSERDFPHIYCDNNFKMPSRTRALLTGENYEVIVNSIVDSLKTMVSLDVDFIVLPCGTAHFFLDDVYKIIPEAKDRVVNLLDCLGAELEKNRTMSALVIAAEGTLKEHLYRRYFEKYNVSCIEPGEDSFGEIRYFIECVKRNEFDDMEKIRARFADFIKSYCEKNIVLGCTEFPVLVSRMGGAEIVDILGYPVTFLDPLEAVIAKLKELLK